MRAPKSSINGYESMPELPKSGVQPVQPCIAVLIPAFNEEKSIGYVLRDIPKDIVGQIVVIDNNSTDRTSEIAKMAGAQVVIERQRGYGSACLAGITALSPLAEIVVFLDADYSDFPEELQSVVQPILDSRADLVIGTRMHSRKTRAVLSPQQRWGNWLATRLMSLCWGTQYTDLGPFRAIRRSSLEMLSMSDRDFGWTVEMQIKAAFMGLRSVEVPVRYRLRIGRSKISGTLKGVILASSKILYTIFRYAWLTVREHRNMQENR
jgi:glycosyltransferase involved in cell wall biosynthesis